jgi:hypothetical protein
LAGKSSVTTERVSAITLFRDKSVIEVMAGKHHFSSAIVRPFLANLASSVGIVISVRQNIHRDWIFSVQLKQVDEPGACNFVKLDQSRFLRFDK